jgi:thiol peroxidase
MATTALGGSPAHTVGELPALGSDAPSFTLTGSEFEEVSLPTGTRTVLNIFPSIATGICQASMRRFNEIAAEHADATVICVSADLPFALAGFCGAEGLENVVTASSFRSGFGTDYGVTLVDSKWEGLLARAVVVVDADGKVTHTQVVPDIGTEPDYAAAVAALG